jgi:fructose-1-phosphate kinase PfkB-like protein
MVWDTVLAKLLCALSKQCDPLTTAPQAVACGTAPATQVSKRIGEASPDQTERDRLATLSQTALGK